jgi:serine/threonine-protein kinase
MVGPRSLIGAELDGRYRIVRRIGAGGFGTVWEAIVRSNGERVAVKTLSGELAERPEASARFRREARAASSIFHPSIVRTLDLGVSDDGIHYLVMELLRGSTLAEVLKVAPLAPAEAIASLAPLLEALVAAHGAGVVHRDLKPENVYLHVPPPNEAAVEDELIVKIVDFGVSKMRGADSLRATGSGVLVGTLFYMSPEQARGATDIDGRADIYAAGALAYEMLTGQRPYNGRDVREVVAQILREPPTPMAELAPHVPAALVAWVSRAMAPDRDERFATAAIALRALRDTARSLGLEERIDQATSELRARVLSLHPELAAPPTLSLPPLAHEESPSVAPPPISEPPPISAAPISRPASTPISTKRSSSRAERTIALAAGAIGFALSAWTVAPALVASAPTVTLRQVVGRPSFGVASLVLSIGWLALALLAPTARSRAIARPITWMSWAQALNLAYQVLQWLAPGFARKTAVVMIGESASLWALPAGVHATMIVVGARGPVPRWIVRALYAFAAVVSLLSGSRWWARHDELGFSGGPLLSVILAAGAVAIVFIGVALARASFRSIEAERRRRFGALALGITAYFGLELLDVLVFLRWRVYPQTMLKLLPLGFIAYGVLGADLMATGGELQVLRWSSRMLRVVIGIGVADLRHLWLPAATAAAALLLAWQSLSIEEVSVTTVATGACMMVLGLLRLDLALLTLVENPTLAVWISRVDHVLFVFMPVTLIVVVRRMARWQEHELLLWASIAAAFFVSPLALGEAYFPTTELLWFGRVARAGVVYLAYQPVQSAAVGYSLAVLAIGTLRQRGGRRRGMLILLLGAMSGGAMMLLGEQRAVLGHGGYPYGNFMIVSLIMITYGVLAGELAEFGAVVRASVAHGFVSALVAGVLAVLLVVVARATERPSPVVTAGVSALVMILALDPIRQRAQGLVDRWLGSDRFDGAEAFRAFAEASSGLSRASDVADAARRVLEQACAPLAAAVLLPADDNGFARGPYGVEADEAAILELRRTSDIVRCGPGAPLALPRGLSRWRSVTLMLPLLHRGRMLGVLAIAPSVRNPLGTRRARAFLRAFAEHVALVLENLALHASVEAAVEAKTSELSSLVVRLEAQLATARNDDEARARVLAELRMAADAARASAIEPAARREAEAVLAMLERLVPRHDGRPASSGNVRAARKV